MFRLLSSQPLTVIVLIVFIGGMLALLVSRLIVRLLNHGKAPLDINSPLPGVAAMSFVFIAALLAAQLMGDMTSSRNALQHEIAGIQSLRLYSDLLPAPQKAMLQEMISEYVNGVVTAEWKQMQGNGEPESIVVRQQIKTMLRLVHTVEADDVRDSLRTGLAELMSARSERLRIASDTVPLFTWGILFSLSLFMLVAFGISHSDHNQWQTVVGVTVVILAALIFIMLLAHDQPYARPDIVNPQNLMQALK